MMTIKETISKTIRGLWGEELIDGKTGIPVIKTNNMSYEGKIDYTELTYRDIDESKIQDNYLQKGDLLIEKSGGTKTHSVGYVNIFEGTDNKYVCNNFILAIRPNREVINPKYLFYDIHYKYNSGRFDDCYNKTTGIQNLKVDNYLAKKINIIDLEKQQMIVSILDTINNIIDANKKQLELLDEADKSRFIEMFGDAVENPKRWATKQLIEMGIFKNGMNFHNDENGMEINCLGVGDFKDFDVISNVSNLPVVSLNDMPSKDYLLQDGDIIFVRSNGNKKMVGRSVMVFPNNTPAIFSGFCIRYRNCDDSVVLPYLLKVLKSDSIRQQMYGRGANIQNLNQQVLSNLLIPLPPIELQKKYVEFSNQIEKLKYNVQQHLNLMQELLNKKMEEFFGGE